MIRYLWWFCEPHELLCPLKPFPSSVVAFWPVSWIVFVPVLLWMGVLCHILFSCLHAISGFAFPNAIRLLKFWSTAFNHSSSDSCKYAIKDTYSFSHCCFTDINPLPPSFRFRYSLSMEAHLWCPLYFLMMLLVFLSNLSNVVPDQPTTIIISQHCYSPRICCMYFSFCI